MTKKEFTELATHIVAVLALLGIAFGVLQAGPTAVDAPEARGVTNFDSLTLSDDLVVGGTAAITGAMTQTGALTAAGGLTVDGGDAVVDDVFNTDENAYVLTGAQTLNPSATYYQMSPTATLTLTLGATGVNEGDFLVVHSLVATSTVIIDTGATQGGGNITLAADDLAVFVYGGAVWVEIASPDNS